MSSRTLSYPGKDKKAVGKTDPLILGGPELVAQWLRRRPHAATAQPGPDRMSDFYSVLKQSIIDRGLSYAGGARGAPMRQARRAMINRLWSYDPPLAEDEIDHRIGQFDTAVARIEDEVVEVFATMEAEAAEDDATRYDHTGTRRPSTR